jgi:hypothetical protein
MRGPKWKKPATARSEPASEFDLLGGVVNSRHSPSRNPPQEVRINAQLIGNDVCEADRRAEMAP